MKVEMKDAAAPRVSFFRRALALMAPHTFANAVAQAEHEPLPETIARLDKHRRAILLSVITVGSAVAVAYFFRSTNIAPMLPRPVLAIGSIGCLAAAIAAKLAWGRRVHPRVLSVLSWIGVCWAALAIL